MVSCRYDKEHGYLLRQHWPACRTIGCAGCLPCETDEEGAVRHCTARKGCTGHLRDDQDHTCTRCVSRVRADLTAIESETVLMSQEAVAQGVDSEAMSLAGPTADPHTFEDRRIMATREAWAVFETTGDEWRFTRAYAAVPEWDDLHPLGLLSRYEMMLREDYGPATTLRITMSRAVDYISSVLDRMAQDDGQDFPAFAREVRRCRQHLEAVRRDSRRPQRGAPCWLCEPTDQCPEDCEKDHEHDYVGKQPHLQLRRGHWCEKDDCPKAHLHGPCEPTCDQEHHTNNCKADCGVQHGHDYGDRWVCPKDSSHRWSDVDYRKGVAADAKTERVSV